MPAIEEALHDSLTVKALHLPPQVIKQFHAATLDDWRFDSDRGWRLCLLFYPLFTRFPAPASAPQKPQSLDEQNPPTHRSVQRSAPEGIALEQVCLT